MMMFYSSSLLLLMLLSVVKADNRWIVTTLQPLDSVVDTKTDLKWTLITKDQITTSDCI
jgi:hypothetical protein